MEQKHILQFTLNLLLVITQGNAQIHCTFTALRESSRSDDSERFTREIRCCSDYTCGGFSESQILDNSWFNNPVYESDKLYMLKTKFKQTFSAPISTAVNVAEFNIPGGLRAGRDLYMRLTTLDGVLSYGCGINICCANGNKPFHMYLRRSTSDLLIDSFYNGNYQSPIARYGILNFNVGSSIEIIIKTTSTGFSVELDYGTRHTDYMAHRFSPNCATVLKISGMVEINQLQFSDNNSY